MIRQIILAVVVMWGLALMPACTRSQTAAPPAADAGNQPPIDNGNVQPSRWPMHVTGSDGSDITIFQPQLEDFQGDTLTGRAAVAVTPAGQQQPIFGAIWLQSRVQTDRSNRTVQILDVQVTKELFPAQQPISQQTLNDAARQAILAQPITLSLDHLLASLEAIHKAQTAAADIQTAPPAIIFKQHPAVKVEYDGDPRLVQTDNSQIMRVINTPFFVALDTSSRMYFLKGAGHWFTAPDAKGPLQFTTQVPPFIAQFADQSGYTDPQQPIPDSEVSSLEIVTATTPTELIWTDGQPQMTPISGTNLLYWANTDSDVFTDISNQQIFVLLSGRWYSGPNTNGPWTFVAPNQLPADFAQIPANSPKASVLADVAGTQQAQDALADTYIPQTAAIDSTNYEQPPVTYDGNPDFEPVQGTNCSYAVNSPCSVLSDGGFYYCCYNACWYQCPTAYGPWVISYRIPHDIYTLPPSCPIYPVSFVNIYGYTGQVVYEGYTPGYVGCYPYNGVVVYGTGYRYKSWLHNNTYVPRPYTFGFAAQYHPYSGRWGFGFGLASGGGQTWIAAPAKQPVGINWFGYGGYRPSKVPTTLKINRTIIDTNNVSRATYDVNVYQRRKDIHPEARGVSPAGPAQEHSHSAGAPAAPAQRSPDLNQNNVYVNDRGDVYRHTDTGWEMRQGNQWKPQPGNPPAQAPAHEPSQTPQKENPQPAHNEPEHNEPAHNEPVHQPPANQPTGAQPVNPQPENPKRENPQPVNQPPANNEPARQEPTREEPQREEPQRQQPQREEPRQQQEPQHQEPRHEEPQGEAPEQDYKARERGDSRSNPAPPPPPPAPAPSHGGGGNPGGKH